MPPKKKDTKTAVENGLSSGSAAAVKKNEDEPVGRTLRKRKVKIQTPAKSLGFKIAVKTTRKKSITNNTNGTAKVVKKKTPPSSIESASIKRRVLIKRQPKAKAEAEAEEHQVIEKIKRNNAAKSKVTLKVQKVNTNNKTSTKQQQNKKATSALNNNNNNKKKTADSKKAKINVQIEDTQLPEPIHQSDSKENDAVNVQQEVQIKKGRKTKKQIIVEETEDSKTAVVPPPKKRVKKNNDAATEENGEEAKEDKRTILDFSAKLIDGTTETRLKKYKGHVCIIVNVASKCGHTATNYKQFVELHEKYAKSKGLRILAFPCNQFGKQEPADNQKICQFAKKKNVKFDLFEKINVNGRGAHPLWKFLTRQFPGPKGPNIDWNFTKFLIDKTGKVVARYPPSCKPLSLIEHLEKLW